MPNQAQKFRFDVALSFAGPHRDKVREIADLVAERLGRERVFFDEWYKHEILGDDMDVLLQRFYHEESLLVLADLSQDYADRPWCQAEARAIRALRSKIDSARDEIQRLRLLNVRLGPGEVPGVFETTGYLDGIKYTSKQCADLILDRLDLLRQRLAHGRLIESSNPPSVFSWPETSAPLPIWPIANHSEARAVFEQLLTRNPPWRYLPLQGSSETGKTHITRQMLANAIQMPKLACGRFDFKGTTDVDAEVRALVQYLEVPLPPANPRLNERLSQILDAMRRRAEPALLIFDTYNEAAGEARDWIERQLLLSVMRDSWLRVVIAGQSVPKAAGATWGSIARRPLELVPPPPEEWFAFGRQHKPNLTLDFVRQAYDYCHGKASVLAELLGREG